MKPILLAIFVALVTSQVVASDQRSVDAGQFDIAGVKLGMTSTEAVSAIKNKLNISERAIRFQKLPQVDSVTGRKEPKYFTVETPSFSIQVNFEPKIPYSFPYDKSNPIVVSSIAYEQPWTPENLATMKKSALEKYGPTSNGPNGNDEWCLEPYRPNPALGCSEFQGPILKLSATKLILNDPRYFQARTNFMNKEQSGKSAF